jgi:hypothetical protein
MEVGMSIMHRIASGDMRLIPKRPDTDAELFTRIANTYGISVKGWTDEAKAMGLQQLKERMTRDQT